jgi:hypothetical protein
MEITSLRVAILLATAAQAFNYYLLGFKGIRNQPLWLFVLAMFCVTEGIIAYTVDPFMWLFVILNMWGGFNFIRGGR